VAPNPAVPRRVGAQWLAMVVAVRRPGRSQASGDAAYTSGSPRLRTHSSAMFVALRRLHEAPTPR